jgi:acyl-CoA synthetase (NDP forming)
MERCDVEVINLKWIFELGFREAGQTWPKFSQVTAHSPLIL